MLSNQRIAILAENDFEEAELFRPLEFLQATHGQVDILCPNPDRTIVTSASHSNHAKSSIKVDRHLGPTVQPADYDALILIGGLFHAEKLRLDESVRQLVTQMNSSEKLIALVSYAPWIIISAGIIKYRKLTASPGIRADIEFAGGEWSNDPVCLQGNWLSCQNSRYFPQFLPKLFHCLSRPSPWISDDTRTANSRSRIMFP